MAFAIEINNYVSILLVYFDSKIKIHFEQIKTNRKFKIRRFKIRDVPVILVMEFE